MSDDNSDNQQREVPEAERVYTEAEMKAAFRYAFICGVFYAEDDGVAPHTEEKVGTAIKKVTADWQAQQEKPGN